MFLFLVSLLLVSFSANISAQEGPPKSQAFLIVDDLVKPGMVSEYEDALKDYISVFAENSYPYPIYIYSTYDYHYYAATPIDLEFSSLDSLYKHFDQTVKASPDKWKAAWDKFEGTYDYNITRIIIQNHEYSYKPENPRLKPEEELYYYWVFTYVKVGKSKEFSKMIKKWKELHQNNDISDGYSVFWGDIGTEQPLYIWQTTGKNSIDFLTQNKIINETLGDEAKTLWGQTRKLTRKIEYKEGWYRPELSYIPDEK